MFVSISYLDRYVISLISSYTWISMVRDSVANASEETDLTEIVISSEIITRQVSSVVRASEV